MCDANVYHIAVKLIFYFNVVQTQTFYCSSRMASLSQRRCFRFFPTIGLCHRGNSDFVGTEPKEAPYETTGNSVELQELIALKFTAALYYNAVICVS